MGNELYCIRIVGLAGAFRFDEFVDIRLRVLEYPFARGFVDDRLRSRGIVGDLPDLRRFPVPTLVEPVATCNMGVVSCAYSFYVWIVFVPCCCWFVDFGLLHVFDSARTVRRLNLNYVSASGAAAAADL